MAFPAEGTWQTVGVRVREHPDGVEYEVLSPAAPDGELLAALRAQVARILSLDVDGSGFPAVGERCPVIAGLQRRYPGLRPVAFWSPYEAAAWAVIGQRIRIRQAAGIKAALARQLGEPVSFGGHVVHAFPAPQRLAASADASRLRAMPPEQALAELRQLPGIGDFSAELILLRGAAAPDELPGHEPRLRRAVALAYGLPEPPSASELERISDNWRPYRTWVTLLLRTFLEDQTHEIAGQPA